MRPLPLLILLILGLLLLLPPLPARAQGARPPAGHTRSLAVPRTITPPKIDGSLDDAGWKYAARATDFWVSESDRAPTEATEVLVLADKQALYFGFRCHDAKPAEIHAEQRMRDGSLDNDDHVVVELDPYHNHRQISEYAVNARGTQADAIAGGRARKIEWKGDWQAAAQTTPEGWTAEIRIPFAILNFQRGADVFGVNFLRFQHRTQEWSRWADITPQGLPEEMGHLTGLAPPRTAASNKLTLMQYATAGHNTLDKRGGIQNLFATTGLDLRYDIANNLSSVVSVNPDFSQVEEDVLSLAFDYNEKFRTDHRTFFQEGSGFFGGSTYFYTPRLPNFDVGLKSFGKVGPLQMGLLGVQAPDGRRDYIARFLRELGPTANASLTFVGTDRPDLSNQLLAFDVGGRFRRSLVFNAGLAATTTRGRFGNGLSTNLSLGYETPYWQTGVAVQRTEPGFFPADGFIAQDSIGTLGGYAFFNYGREFANGPFRRANASLSFAGRNTLSGLLQTRSLSLYGGFETRSNLQFSLGMTQGPYRPWDKKAGDWSSDVNYDRYYTASIYFDTRSDRRGYGISYSWGNLGGGPYSDLAPNIWFKPSRQTYISYSYERADSFGVTTQQVLWFVWEMSAEQSLALRWVQSGGNAYRIAYRRQVRRGFDIFAVYDTEPDSPDRFTLKFVHSFHLR